MLIVSVVLEICLFESAESRTAIVCKSRLFLRKFDQTWVRNGCVCLWQPEFPLSSVGLTPFPHSYVV